MVARNPLVLVDGRPAELPAGDTINGAGGGGGAVDPCDPTTPFFGFSDFIEGSAETGEIGGGGWSFTNGSVTKLDGIQNHPGIVRRTNGTTANQVASFYIGNAVGDQVCRFDEWDEATFVFKEGAANQADMTLQIGIFDAMGTHTPVHGAYLELKPADTNYFLVVRNGSVENRYDTGIAGRTTNWHKLKIRRASATEIIFNINGGADISRTSNVPDAADTICIGSNCSQTGTTGRTHDLDFISFKLLALTR